MGWRATEVADSDAPLERLRTRSSAERWRSASERIRSESRVGSRNESQVLPVREANNEVAPASMPVVPPEVSPALSAEEASGSPVKSLPEAEPGLAPIPLTRPVPRVAQNTTPRSPAPDRKFTEPAKHPRQLRKITEIMPYFDYVPDPEVAKDDPCLYRCPRPDGAPCKQYPPGETPACPEEVKLSEEIYAGRMMPENLFGWEASNLWHNPLYFEDPALERYGHTHPYCTQPFASVGKFGLQLLGWPYQATIDPPCKRVYTLGWYRPGECAPKKCYQIPWNTEAAAVQAGVVAGGVALFP